MDYSKLVTAIREKDSSKADELIKAFMPRLMSFLRIHMNADRADAKDCAQETLLVIIESIREDRLRDPEQVTSYILSTCRNTYLKMKNKSKEELHAELPDNPHYAAPQMEELLNKEQEQILKWCMKQLKEKHRKFMQYWFDHPGEHANRVAEYFDISVNSVWTRKHRLIKKLNECYRKKSKL